MLSSTVLDRNKSAVESIDERAYCNLDKRGSQPAIPPNLEYYLTDVQLRTLHNLEDFGWNLYFVRRPLFEVPIVVISSPEGKQHAVIEEDGSLNLEPHITLRSNNSH